MKYVRNLHIQYLDDTHYIFTLATNAGEVWTTRHLYYNTIVDNGYVGWMREPYTKVNNSESIPQWMINHLETYGWMLSDPKQRSMMNNEEKIRLPFKGSEYEIR